MPITRLTKLTSGALHFDGEEYQNEPASRRSPGARVARTFQTVRLLPGPQRQATTSSSARTRGREGDGQTLVQRLLNRTTSPVGGRGGAPHGARRVRELLPLRAVLRHPAPGRDRPRDRHRPAAAAARRAHRGHEPAASARRSPALLQGPALRGPGPAAGRARRADDDRHLRPRVRDELRQADRRGHARATSSATRRSKRPTSAGSGATMLEITDLHVSYGNVQAVRGVGADRDARAGSPSCSAPTAPARPRRSRRSPGCSPPDSGSVVLEGKDITGMRAAQGRAPRHRAGARGPAGLRARSRSSRTCGWAPTPRAKANFDQTLARVLRDVPDPQATAPTPPPACSAAASSRCSPSAAR